MAKSLRLRVKRIYVSPSPQDGLRFLVDRLWPRGLKKEACELDGWLKEVAPSDELRGRFAERVHRGFILSALALTLTLGAGWGG